MLPETSDREIFADVSGKNRQGKKGKRGKNEEEKKENCRREGGKLEMEVGKVIKSGENFFFFFLIFYWEHFTLGKKSGKTTFPSQKNMPVIPLY